MSFVQDLEATIVEAESILVFPSCWRLGAGCKRLSHLSWYSRPFVRRGLSPLDNFEFRPGRKCCPALFFSEPIHLEAELIRNLSHNLRHRLGKIGGASGRERVSKYGWISVVAVSIKKKKKS